MAHLLRAIARRFWPGGFVGTAPITPEPDDREAFYPNSVKLEPTYRWTLPGVPANAEDYRLLREKLEEQRALIAKLRYDNHVLSQELERMTERSARSVQYEHPGNLP